MTPREFAVESARCIASWSWAEDLPENTFAASGLRCAASLISISLKRACSSLREADGGGALRRSRERSRRLGGDRDLPCLLLPNPPPPLPLMYCLWGGSLGSCVCSKIVIFYAEAAGASSRLEHDTHKQFSPHFFPDFKHPHRFPHPVLHRQTSGGGSTGEVEDDDEDAGFTGVSVAGTVGCFLCLCSFK